MYEVTNVAITRWVKGGEGEDEEQRNSSGRGNITKFINFMPNCISARAYFDFYDRPKSPAITLTTHTDLVASLCLMFLSSIPALVRLAQRLSEQQRETPPQHIHDHNETKEN